MTRSYWVGLLTGIPGSVLLAHAVVAGTIYSGVAAGDMSANDAILWTRTTDGTSGISENVTAQVSTDATFSTGVRSFSGATQAASDYTLKLDATGLQSGTKYYYRFRDPAGVNSQVGVFHTAPAANIAAEVKLGFSGDTDGQWRPFPSISNLASKKLDFFVFLGDTLYETASAGSPAAADPLANPSQALADYRNKYLENITPVQGAGGNTQPGLQPQFQATGAYTLLDNHELGDKQFQFGGAPRGTPAGAGVDGKSIKTDVNATGAYMNKTTGFKTLIRAFDDYHPNKTPTVSAPTDPRSGGTQQMYFSQQWGRNVVYIQTDDRSYRDVRMMTASGIDDTGARADNPDRTMLGSTQVTWLETSLLTAQTGGTPWKVVSISSPIDLQGRDGGNSWVGGYRAERNALLKFIADNHISDVVFLSTDDHETRISQLAYETAPGDPDTYTPVPGAFQIVTGAIGATNTCSSPIATGTLTPAQVSADCRAGTLAARKELLEQTGHRTPPGLQGGTPSDAAAPGAANFPGLRISNLVNVTDPNANVAPQAADFYSPDTFAYATLAISADGRTLSVEVDGIPTYLANAYLTGATSAAPTSERIISFDVAASEPWLVRQRNDAR